jgi:hypothetical protein
VVFVSPVSRPTLSRVSPLCWLSWDGVLFVVSRRRKVRFHRLIADTEDMANSRSLWSCRSDGSILSVWSKGSVLSIGSSGSVLSIGSIGSFSSIGSIGSFLCIGSILSAASVGAVLSWRSRGGILAANQPSNA